METSVQNGLAAAGYALLFLLLLRTPRRKDVPLLLIACAFSTIYNIAYDTAIHWRIITSIALFVRVLPPMEACWRCLGNRSDVKAALSVLMTILTVRAFGPDALTTGYLGTRTLLTATAALVCFCISIANACGVFSADRFAARNLVLQTAWMMLHSVFSFTSPWYNATWPRRALARWAFVILMFSIVLLYKRLISSYPNPPARSEAAAALD